MSSGMHFEQIPPHLYRMSDDKFAEPLRSIGIPADVSLFRELHAERESQRREGPDVNEARFEELSRLYAGIKAVQAAQSNELDSLRASISELKTRSINVQGTGMTQSVARKIEALENRVRVAEDVARSLNAGELPAITNRVVERDDLVDLQIEAETLELEVEENTKRQKLGKATIAISACGLVVLEPVAYFVTDYLVQIILGVICVGFILAGYLTQPTAQGAIKAKKNLRKAQLKYNQAIMKESQSVISSYQQPVSGNRELPSGNDPGSDG